MNTVTEGQVEKLLEDISSIKSIISQNKKLIRQVVLPRHFKLLYLFFGISLIGFSLVFYLLMKEYGGYNAIPENTKILLYNAITADWMLLVLIKYLLWVKSLSKIDKRYDMNFAFQKLFSYRVVHVLLPLKILIIAFCVFFIQRGTAYYVIPTISIGLGLVHNFLGSVTRLWQWILSGYWLLVSGYIVLVAEPVSVPLAVSISLGCGCILFAATGWIPDAAQEE